MGLLDALTSGSSGGYGGLLDGLLSYPTQQAPQNSNFLKALLTGQSAAPTFAAPPPPPVPPLSGAPLSFPGMGAGGTMPVLPQTPSSVPYAGMGAGAALPGASPQPAAAPAPPAAPADNGPVNYMDIGGYKMPQFGSPSDYMPKPQPMQTAPASMPTNVPAQSAQPSATFLGADPNAGIGDRVLAGIQNLGSQNGEGLISRLANTVSGFATGQRTDPVGMQMQNQRAQYSAFINAGLTPQEAMLAVLNPEAGKTLINEALTTKEKYQKTGTDALGNESYGFVNERMQTVNGRPIGADGGAGGQGAGFLAPGVKQMDSSLTGQDYLNQFSPEVKAAVQNYVDGKSMPTGNPRKGFTQTVKMIAQKYGADTGQQVDDTTYAARRTMRNQLSSSAPSSLGGQINIGNTAAGHLADLTQRALELGNVDTGIAPLTSVVNNVRGLGTEQAAKMEALKGAAQHYGQEITKFYAGSPGGTAERDRFIESVNGARSPKELAAILATEGELMRSRLDALGGQIKGVLGDEGMKQYPVLRPDGTAALAKVEENVSRLKSGQGPGPNTGHGAPAGGLPAGWSVKVR